jgi:hypothetical protein
VTGQAGDGRGRGRSALAPRLVLPLVFAAVVLAGVAVPPVAPGVDRLHVAGIALPETCMLRATTGFPCAGCGLTRSWIAALHGKWGWSVEHHRFGGVALVYLALQAVRHVVAAAAPSRWGRVVAVGGRWLDLAAIALVVLFVGNWLAVLLISGA